MTLELDLIQTIALAVVLLLIGDLLVRKIKILSKYCIPAPVVGGILFAILALVLRQTDILIFEMDTTLQGVAMTMFFTSVGFGASLRVLKQGGSLVVKFLAAAGLLVVFQNIIGVGLAKTFGLDPLLGLATGSIPMTGGHGTAGAFGPILEDMGVTGANTIAIAAATFGLISGSMIGGPVGKRLIEKNNLSSTNASTEGADLNILEDDKPALLVSSRFSSATFQILIAMGIGTIVSALLEKTGFTFPAYIGAMLVGATMSNISEATEAYETPIDEINIIGEVALALFLSMALMTLRLWELADLAIPFIAMLVGQVTFMAIFASLVTFRIMGSGYDAAILSAGHCGFGLGATPNGIAVMSSVTSAYGPSPTAFFVLPIVGGLFIDFVNSGIITVFLNIFG